MKIGKSWMEVLESAPVNVWEKLPQPKTLEKMFKKILKQNSK